MSSASHRPSTASFEVNGRTYHPPQRAVAVICIDGCADEYLDTAMAHGAMPATTALSVRGYRGMARAALPSFTNVNNAAIATGAPPATTGISGNFFLDPSTGEEVMMNSARYLRCETIFAAAARAGRRVAVVTAKEKLRDLLSAGLAPPGGRFDGIAISSEKAHEAALATHGIDDLEALVAPRPEIYSGDASTWVLQAGVRFVEEGLADFLYLSLTDFMQHKFAPEDAEAIAFYRDLDVHIGRLLELGVVVGITADHGMNAKQREDGSPNVIWLESLLDASFGAGFRVILPITDPYVVHHGALGSFAVVHAPPGADLAHIADGLRRTPGITEVFDRESAALQLELPRDRIGELIVLSARDVVLGRRPEMHDLSVVSTGLRSHGGRYEEMVPFLLSDLDDPRYRARTRGDVRNFDIFEFTINGATRA